MSLDPHIENWSFKKNQSPAILITTGLLIASLLIAIFFTGWLSILIFIVILVVWSIITNFFRDPARVAIDKPGLAVGPCDGEVVAVEKFEEGRYLNTEMIRVTMYMNIFNVHVQRAPLAGEVKVVDYRPGEFLKAFMPEASEVNEHIMMQIDSPYGVVLVKQISGYLARRCYNYAQPGDQIQTGQRFGHIKFGSRVDLYLPPDAEILIKVGDKVIGGLTPMANLAK